MGTSPNKEQKIEVHVNINMDKYGGKSQKYIASVNSNNPSAIINLSGINSEINETTETSQINPTNQSVINTQNSGNYQNNGNSENNLNNGNKPNNDDPAPLSQNSSIKSSTNQPININEGGIGCNKPYENDNNTTRGNININEGGNSRVEVNVTETVGKPTRGNININEGGNKRVEQEYKTPKETPYSKPINTTKVGYLSKNDLNNNDSDNPLEFSRTVFITDIDKDKINEKKDLIYKLVEEGFFPLFMQLDKEKPLFLLMKNYVTVQNVVEEYKNLIGYNNNNKKYTLYNKKTKSVIPQDVPIKDLNLNYFTYISNKV